MIISEMRIRAMKTVMKTVVMIMEISVRVGVDNK